MARQIQNLTLLCHVCTKKWESWHGFGTLAQGHVDHAGTHNTWFNKLPKIKYQNIIGITSINFFPSSNFTPLYNVFILIEVTVSCVANLKVKFECSSWGNKFNQKWVNLLIYKNNFLKEDWRNWSFSVYNNIIKFFNT